MSVLQHMALGAAWAAYAALHSWLASPAIKSWARNRWPGVASRYRLVYNVLAVVLLIPPLALNYGIASVELWSWPRPWNYLANGLAVAALAGFYWSLRHYDSREFLGLRAASRQGLRISPLHRHLRHPWYFFALILIWTRDMDSAFLVTAAMITLYFIVGSRLEESQLIREYGDAYRRYRERVPGLFPFPGRHIDASTARELEAQAADFAGRSRATPG